MAIVMLGLISTRYMFGLRFGRYDTLCIQGARCYIIGTWFAGDLSGVHGVQPVAKRYAFDSDDFEAMTAPPAYGVSPRGIHYILCPLWTPLVTVAVPTLMLWLVGRWRRLPQGHCPTCDYNLTGNVSGRCPECGQPIGVPAAAAQA